MLDLVDEISLRDGNCVDPNVLSAASVSCPLIDNLLVHQLLQGEQQHFVVIPLVGELLPEFLNTGTTLTYSLS